MFYFLYLASFHSSMKPIFLHIFTYFVTSLKIGAKHLFKKVPLGDTTHSKLQEEVP